MRFALGMDNREIARALGRSDGATKVLIHRAIKQLEEIVGDPGAAGNRPRPASAQERPMSEAAAQLRGPAARSPRARRAAGGPRPSAWRRRSRASPRWPPTSSRPGSCRRCATRATGCVRPRRVVVGGAAGAALVLLRARRRPTSTSGRRSAGVRDMAERSAARLSARDAQAARRALSEPAPGSAGAEARREHPSCGW